MPKAKYKIDKNLNLYYVNLDTGLRKDNGQIIYKKLRAKTTAELDAKVEEFFKNKQNGFLPLKTQTTVSEWVDTFLSAYKSNCKLNTRLYYENMLADFKKEFSNTKLIDIKEIQLQNYLNEYATTHSQRSVKGMLSILRSLFKKAVNNRLIPYSPAEGLRAVGGTPPKEKRALTVDERNAITRTVKTHPFGMFVAFMYYCGLRRGECAALTYNDIQGNFLVVNKQFIFPNNSAVLSTPKTKAGVRTIPIPTTLQKLIKDMPKTGELLFTNSFGGPLSKTTIRKGFDSFLSAAFGDSPPPITEHWLRHNYATILFESGVDLLTASNLMGHEDKDVTLEIYTHLSEQQKEKSFENVFFIA